MHRILIAILPPFTQEHKIVLLKKETVFSAKVGSNTSSQFTVDYVLSNAAFTFLNYALAHDSTLSQHTVNSWQKEMCRRQKNVIEGVTLLCNTQSVPWTSSQYQYHATKTQLRKHAHSNILKISPP